MLLRPSLHELHSKKIAALADVSPIHQAAGCPCSSVGSPPRFESAAPARSQTARGLPAFQSCSRGRAAPRRTPTKEKMRREALQRRRANTMGNSRRNNCNGKRTKKKLPLRKIRPSPVRKRFAYRFRGAGELRKHLP